jgi:deoxycytidylate deaminase
MPQRNGRGHGSDDYIENWDEYFLTVAQTVKRKSKDPRCKVGAVIVSSDRLIISTGFNGLARGVFDDEGLLADTLHRARRYMLARLSPWQLSSRVAAAGR